MKEKQVFDILNSENFEISLSTVVRCSPHFDKNKFHKKKKKKEIITRMIENNL